jgi:predicted transport protein
MSDLKLFRLSGNLTKEIKSSSSDFEKSVPTSIEANLESLLGVRFLATEYSTGKTHAGRIDTLGIDENSCPVIIEYKRFVGENVINQGLFYLDWLLDHRAEFKLLTLERYGKAVADEIDWSSARLVCIAGDFTRYNEHAVQQIAANIELIRYRQFGSDLLLFEQVNAVNKVRPRKPAPSKKTNHNENVWPVWLETLSPDSVAIIKLVEAYIESLGDDVQRKDLKRYIAFKGLRNFATVVGLKKSVLLYLHLNPDKQELTDGFTRNVRNLGHWGTGDVEVVLSKPRDLDKATDSSCVRRRQH